MKRSIALIGEYDPTYQPHVSTSAAIEHSCSASGVNVGGIWVSTDEMIKIVGEPKNKQIIRRYYNELWNKWNLALANELVAPDVKL